LSATDLVRRAAGNGVEFLSLTDHDTLQGLSLASKDAAGFGMRFVNGVEISCEWGGGQVHILGYAFDSSDAALNRGLADIRSGRVDRARRMALDLEKAGIPGCFEGAMRYAENRELINRAHFARYLVEIGICRDVRRVFDVYLIPGRPGYVPYRWASVKDAVRWILDAGGVASIAHPGRYKFSRNRLHSFFEEFKDGGGQALEVVSGSHSPDEIVKFGRLAAEYNFAASCGSDFHGPDESYSDLGRIPPIPAALTPVWEMFRK
jgi:predicted metal-dependent phosphoesterase TrpH